MKKVILAGAAVLMLASCSKTEKAAAIGAASGAVIGGVVTNDWRGAAVGAAAGGATGALVSEADRSDRRRSDGRGWDRDRRDQCTYRDRFGRTYQERCR